MWEGETDEERNPPIRIGKRKKKGVRGSQRKKKWEREKKRSEKKDIKRADIKGKVKRQHVTTEEKTNK